MRDLSIYIEDFLLEHDLDPTIKKEIEARLISDPEFAQEVESMRRVIEGLQLNALTDRVRSKLMDSPVEPGKRKRAFSAYKWFIPFLILICGFTYLYFSRFAQTESPVENPQPAAPIEQELRPTAPVDQKPENPVEQITEPPVIAEQNQESVNKPQGEQPGQNAESIQENRNSELLAMHYFKRRLPIGSGTRGDESELELSLEEKALLACVELISNNNFSEAQACLTQSFGKREEDAAWFRALVLLATDGKSTAKSDIQIIANNRLHIYSRQAKALLQELNN